MSAQESMIFLVMLEMGYNVDYLKGAVAKLTLLALFILFVFRRETEKIIFANLNTFYYISCPP